MTLTAEQTKWAEGHVGKETVARGRVTGYEPNRDGGVDFTVLFTATPPPSAEQLAEAAAAEERARQDAAAAAEDRERQERERIQAMVDDRVAAALDAAGVRPAG